MVDITGMSKARLAIIYLLMFGLLGGHLFDAITFREHWPFSYYGMFDGVTTSPGVQYSIVCLTPGKDGQNVPFAVKPTWLPSLPGYKFESILWKLDYGPYANRAKLHRLLEDYLDSYSKYRKYAGLDIPVATGVRLYRLQIPLQLPVTPVSANNPAASGGVLIMEVDHPLTPTMRGTTRPG